ncbi:nucleic-acid-binding protein from transposon X-element [Trichonephila clavipes]|nr:nucleic-acid-binding protein from transposon X-element [Trichonephila clavipes]
MEVAGPAENNNFAQPKVKPIMLKFNKNFNLILQHLNRKYPDSVNKLTGEYIKITAANIDQHGEITNELKEKGEEFYAVPNPGDRPLKMVLKGLPSNTDIDDIKYDLANQGLPVMKVAQLTQRKSKFPLPLFLVEVRKNVRTVGTYAILALAAICPLLGIRSAEGQAHRSATTATISIRVH